MISGTPIRAVCHALLFALLMSSPASSQQAVQFHHLTVKDGLSQGSVLCILQDRQGLMWFGTQDGLNRYDGYKFTVFRHDPAVPHSLNDNFIVQLAEDTSGTLWVGTLDMPAKLNRYDPYTETFIEVPRESVNLRGAKINSARSEFEDQSGVWWYGMKEGGLKRVDPTMGKTMVYKHSRSDTSSLANDDVFQIVQDPSGLLWVSTSGGLDKFDPSTGMFLHYRHDEHNPKSLSDNETWPLLMDRQAGLWVGSYQGGLNRFDRSTETFIHFRHSDSDPRSLAGDRIYALFQDRSGIIWVGTGDNGLDYFNPELSSFTHYLHDPANRFSLSDNNVQSMSVDQKGIVWIGTRNGLNRLDRETGIFTRFKHDGNNPKSLGEDMVQALFVDRAGVLWVGTSNNGLDRMNSANGTFSHFRHDPSDPSSLSDNSVYALCESRKGDLWIGTYSGGLSRLDPKTGKFKVYRHNPAVGTSLGADGAWALLEDRDGVLWVGTYGGGLDQFSSDADTFTHYTHSSSDPKTLSDNVVTCICEDRTGSLWIGTASGLNRFDRQTKTFERFFEKDGLANDMVFGILPDHQGNLWISTNKGVSRFNPQSKKFVTYDYSDGLQGNEFNQGAYAVDHRSGEIFFGGSNGFNVFNPEAVKENPYIPPVVFSSFTRYNSDNTEGRPIEDPGIRIRPAIAVSYKDDILTFEFAALSYYNSQKNQYAYKLEGFNDNWIQLGTDHRATFTGLDGGNYVLQVRGSNNDGLWNENGAELRIRVNPPWWKTTWAYGSYAVLLLGFLYGIRTFELNLQKQKARMRESELHAKAVEAEKRALEAENERQTKELEDARKLQLSMLPKEVPKTPGYDIAVFMKTATEVGGDYYDFSLTPEGHVNVALGDAAGHGMQAGTIVTLMKGLFVSQSSKLDLQTFFHNCSRAIKDIRLGRLYMALTLARFAGKNVYLSSAGMPPAYIHRRATGAIDEILLKAVPLGAMKNFPYSLHETEMVEGDTLLLMTDGLPEQKNSAGEMFDYSRVTEYFKGVADQSPEEIIAHLFQKGEAWMANATQDDDITLLVIRKTSEGVPPSGAKPHSGEKELHG